MKRYRAISVLALILGSVLAVYFYSLRPLTDSSSFSSSTVSKPTAAERPNELPPRAAAGVASAAEPPQQPAHAAPQSSPRTRLVDIDIADFARRYAELASAARKGDVDAAYELYRGTYACADVPSDPTFFEGLLEEHKADASARQFMTDRFKKCSILSREQRQSWGEWLELAAKLGSHKAAIAYISNPPAMVDSADYWARLKDYKATADQMLTREIRDGNPDALLAASEAYGGQSPLYPPDDEKEYAYLYAYLMATGQKGGAIFDIAAEKEARLTGEQVSKATAMGQEIFNQCCKR